MKLIIIIVLTFISASAISEISFLGIAKDGETLRYYEKHKLSFKNEQTNLIKTSYFNDLKDKEPFAQMSSDFTKNPYIPEMSFKDTRFKTKLISKIDGDEVIIIEEITTKTNRVKTKEKRIKMTKNMVLGQGYHNFVLDYLKNPTVGESKLLRLLVLEKMDYYDFLLKYHGQEKENSHLLKFELIIDHILLKYIAPTVIVYYDKKTKKLISYEGPTNIADKKGQTQNLKIKYDY